MPSNYIIRDKLGILLLNWDNFSKIFKKTTELVVFFTFLGDINYNSHVVFHY